MPLPAHPMGCRMDALPRLLLGPWTSHILWTLRQHGPLRSGAHRRTVLPSADTRRAPRAAAGSCLAAGSRAAPG
jgi:hypothetical protein